MPSISRRTKRASALTNLKDLTKREMHAMDYLTARGQQHAFSISFNITRTHVQALLYYDQRKQAAKGTTPELEKENTPAPSISAPSPPAPVPPPPPSIHAQVQQQQAPKQAALSKKAKKPKIDRNALSARSGNLLSNSALKAQARADAKEKERRYEGSVSKHVADAVAAQVAKYAAGAKRARPADLSPGRNENETFETKADAERFLERLEAEHDMWLIDEAGVVIGEGPDGKTYGGEGDPPLPPRAAEAFRMIYCKAEDSASDLYSEAGGNGDDYKDSDSEDAGLYEKMHYTGCMSAARR